MNRVLVALNLPRRISSVLSYATFVVDRLANDPVFSSPSPPLADVRAHVAALEKADRLVHTRAAGSTEARDADLAVVRNDLVALGAYVQRVADENPDRAAAIVESAGMSVKGSSGHGKADFEVKRGKVSGSVRLVARAAPTRASYDWEYGTDGVSFTRADSTVRSDTVIAGLTPSLRYFFRVRIVTSAGVGDWSDAVSLIVT